MHLVREGMAHVVRSAENALGDYIGTKDLVKMCRDGTWTCMGVSTGSMHLALIWGVYT